MTDPDTLDAGMDERLREYGARWRAELPTPAEPTPAIDSPRERRRWIVAAAAAAVAVVLGVTFAVTSGDREVAPTEPADDVVPWKPLQPTDPELAVTTPGPSEAQVAAAPPCREGDLALVDDFVSGVAAGRTYQSGAVELARRSPCRVQGYPQVDLLDPEGRSLDIQVEPDRSAGPPEPVLVTRDEPASLTIAWAVNHYCNDVDNARIRVGLPSDAGVVMFPGFGRTRCNPGEGTPAPRVQALQSVPYGEPTSPYDRLSVTGDLDLTADHGETVEFTVTLEGKVDIPLEPCPDYTILTSAGEVTYGLNCADVPYRDAQGQPYLPAGAPVTFAIEAEAGVESTPEFRWVLEAPGLPWVGGVLTVGSDEADG